MADVADNDPFIPDYEDEEQGGASGGATVTTNGTTKKEVKGTYVSIHSSGFRDFLLKPEVLRAISDCGFEYVILFNSLGQSYHVLFLGRAC